MKKAEQVTKIHPDNPYNASYDLPKLQEQYPALEQYIIRKKHGGLTIDFSNAEAVNALNAALMLESCQLKYWKLPVHNLIPAIPGRMDYLCHLKDLLEKDSEQPIDHSKIKGIDIGTGAGAVYPILGNKHFQWKFLASDIDQKSVNNALKILKENKVSRKVIDVKLQPTSHYYFTNIIGDERVDFSICNPPFFSSEEEAQKANQRKWNQLKVEKSENNKFNFQGTSSELWAKGGELQFVRQMIFESKRYQDQCLWFSSLISNKDHLFPLKKQLRKVGVKDFEIIQMAQGNKVSRFIAWTFKAQEERKSWAKQYWN
ncbi:23S rRNA (adenine(1618)-N(6))-methyltransferase RlmF [Persicobacter diffluens]|uniref:Ribosomal RNA large subunit methyltransferase F n=1 Tax=Persicobacter diffluens TaxID=981 RepID=A0AAN4W1V6_9BACT|nr:ribosomal RNA large subunit methyltransferase F [Persicobacter diffluens]